MCGIWKQIVNGDWTEAAKVFMDFKSWCTRLYHAQYAKWNFVRAEYINAFKDSLMRAAPPVVDSGYVVQGLRTIDTDSDTDVVASEQRSPLGVQQSPVRLHHHI
jgi:hypothetical protein